MEGEEEECSQKLEACEIVRRVRDLLLLPVGSQ
jgi:hypothetical protein